MKNLLKQNNFGLLIFTWALIILVNSCRKDPPVAGKDPVTPIDTSAYIPDTCHELPISLNANGYTLIGPSHLYWKPDFNPKNANEFVCIENNTHLITYNMATRQKKEIFTGYIPYQPKWSSQGWIVFTFEGQLWKVKEDGTSLTRLTNDPAGNDHYYADWSPDGEKILFFYITSSTEGNERIIDKNGNFIKDFVTNQVGGVCVWNPDGIHFSGYCCGGNKLLVNSITGEISYLPYGVRSWFPKQKMWITSDTDYVYVYHSGSKTLVPINGKCGTNQPSDFSVSNDGSTILAGRMYKHYINKDTAWYESKIITMHPNGSHLQVIEIP